MVESKNSAICKALVKYGYGNFSAPLWFAWALPKQTFGTIKSKKAEPISDCSAGFDFWVFKRRGRRAHATEENKMFHLIFTLGENKMFHLIFTAKKTY